MFINLAEWDSRYFKGNVSVVCDSLIVCGTIFTKVVEIYNHTKDERDQMLDDLVSQAETEYGMDGVFVNDILDVMENEITRRRVKNNIPFDIKLKFKIKECNRFLHLGTITMCAKTTHEHFVKDTLKADEESTKQIKEESEIKDVLTAEDMESL